MTFMRSLIPIAALGAAAAIAAACGGGGAGSTTSTAPAGTGTAAPHRLVTPFPTPQITGNQISSPTKGYAAVLPNGWRFFPNRVQTADASADAIFEPLAPGANLQANIVVNCIVIKADTPEQRITFQKTQTAREGLNSDIQISATRVDGIDATVLSYRFQSQQTLNTPVPGATPPRFTPPLDKQDIFFSNSKCDWTITTTVGVGQRPKYQAIFDAFLASFKLIS